MFWGDRKKQLTEIGEKILKTMTLNSFVKKINSNIDFIKLDTEGTEYEILKNFSSFENILGIRSEVCFDKLFKNIRGDSFSKIHRLLLSHDFVLLNFDYDGRGDYFSEFLKSNERYGILQNTDAVWIKRPEKILNSKNQRTIINYCNFLFRNNAPDLAMFILDNFAELSKEKSPKSYEFCSFLTIKHLRSLKWEPSQNINKHKDFYEKIFQSPFPSMNEFNESEIFNKIDL